MNIRAELRLKFGNWNLFWLLGFGVFLGGCAVGPDYKKPAATAAMPASYKEGTNEWKVAEPRAERPKGKWWEIFNDAELNRLEEQAVMNNQQLKAAVANFLQARSLLNIAKSELYPTLDLSASAIRQRDSRNRPVNGARLQPSTSAPVNLSPTYNTFTGVLDSGYELDVWGRVRRNIEAAKATAQADEADVQTIRLGIEADVASDYFNLRALDAELELLKSSIAVFEKSLELTRNRRAGGIAADLDVSQAETLLKSTEAQVPVTALERARTEHALAVLTGQPASSFSEPARTLDIQPPVVPPGVPSELLERRPDIARAEREMAAANAGIGVAKAAFFPTIRLSALGGLESLDAGLFFNGASRLWAVGPSVTLPIFEGGRNRANLTRAELAYEENVALYRQTVLTAFSEVEDNLAAQHLLAAQHEAEIAAWKSAEKTLEIANNRYRSGLVTYLEVATAESAALDHQRATVRLAGERLVSAVGLMKALGGHW